MTAPAPFAADAAGLILALDASTYVGTVAVLRGGAVVSERDAAMRGADEERLMPAVVAALADAGLAAGRLSGALDAVVCGAGPGSFTSLRIAASIAKGLAVAAAAPLYAVPSLTLGVAAANPPVAAGRYVATSDAMRGEWFAAYVCLDVAGVTAYDYLGVVRPDDAADLARGRDALLLAPPGDGPAPHARGVAALAPLLAGSAPVGLDHWEPEYGRRAEAQVKWEVAHGRALPATGAA